MNALALTGRALPNPTRKSEFNWLIANEIVDRLSEGEFLTKILRDDHMPTSWAVNQWFHEHPDFAKEVARAREMGALHWMEQAVEIGVTPQDGRKVTYRSDGSVEMVREDAVAARKLASWALMEAAKKICPAKFGDKVAVTGGSAEDAPVQVQHSVRKIERAFVRSSAVSES